MDDGTGVMVPIAAVEDGRGVVTDIRENELVVKPATRAELDALVQQLNATIVWDDHIPLPPPSLQVPNAMERPATLYRLRLDPMTLPERDVQAAAGAAGLGGDYRISSAAALRLMAYALSETAAGHPMTPNVVMYPMEFLHGSREFQDVDALQWGTNWAPQSGVTTSSMFQYLAGIGAQPRSVSVAIIDGGFWLSPAGIPYRYTTYEFHQRECDVFNACDLPVAPTQYDLVQNDTFAGGENPSTCTGGSLCAWHGNNSASVACAQLNNGEGATGTGGLVCDPWLFRVGSEYTSMKAAFDLAHAWGAQVVNVSMGGVCNEVCDTWATTIGFYNALATLGAAGTVVVAAAGNDALDLDETNVIPCEVNDVICVGALQSGTRNARDYSNFHGGVDVFAPTNIPAAPNPTTVTADGGVLLDTAGGTSAASPYVAGVVANLKALNPSLTHVQVRSLLQQTASASTDPKVPFVLDAFAAVEAAAPVSGALDTHEPDDTGTNAQTGSGLLLRDSSDPVDIHAPGNQDHYALTFSEFSTVTAYTTSMSLLDLQVNRTYQGTAAAITGVTSNQATGIQYEQLPPGTFRMVVASAHRQPYEVYLSAYPAPLSPDVLEDAICQNNNHPLCKNDTQALLSTAVANQFYKLNLHRPTDEDWISFVVPPLTLFKTARLSMFTLDEPVTVTVTHPGGFDQTSTLMPGAAASAFNLVSGPDMMPSPALVHVRGNAATRYRASLVVVDQNSGAQGIVDEQGLWWLDVAGPLVFEIMPGDTQHWLVDRAAGGLVTLDGPMVHVALLDAMGVQVADGLDDALPGVETLPVPPAPELGVVKVNLDEGALGPTTYAMTWAPAGASSSSSSSGAGSSGVSGVVSSSSAGSGSGGPAGSSSSGSSTGGTASPFGAAMLTAINAARAGVQPPNAVPLPAVTYDLALEAASAAWLASCTVGENPSPGRTTGQTAHSFTVALTAQRVVDAWEVGAGCYNEAANTCNAGCTQCRNHLQVVWRDSTRVGCAERYCSRLTTPYLFHCTWQPAGNVAGQRPY